MKYDQDAKRLPTHLRSKYFTHRRCISYLSQTNISLTTLVVNFTIFLFCLQDEKILPLSHGVQADCVARAYRLMLLGSPPDIVHRP